jgi:hypothetical protein
MDHYLLRFALSTPDFLLRYEIILAVLTICFSVYFLCQKLLPFCLFGEDSEYAGYIYNAMGVVFSLVFAFITVLVWQNYNSVNDAVTKEANNLNNIYRLYSAFPPDVQKVGREYLRDYTKTVIDEEWPLLSKDEFSLNAYQKLLKIEDQIITFQPKTPGQINAHQQMLRLMSDAAELRRSRIYNAKFALAAPAWIGLTSSVVVFLIFSCLFQMKSVRTHLILMLFLSLTIVGVLYFLVIYIHPFLGPMAIPPDAFSEVMNLSWKYK